MKKLDRNEDPQATDEEAEQDIRLTIELHRGGSRDQALLAAITTAMDYGKGPSLAERMLDEVWPIDGAERGRVVSREEETLVTKPKPFKIQPRNRTSTAPVEHSSRGKQAARDKWLLAFCSPLPLGPDATTRNVLHALSTFTR